MKEKGELGRKAVLGTTLTVLLIGALTLAFNIQQAGASEPPPTEWTRTSGGAGGDAATSVVETVDGGYALAGSTESFGAGGRDFWLIKLGPPPPPPVGGVWIPVDKLALLAPWIILAMAIVAITVGTLYAEKRWTGKTILV